MAKSIKTPWFSGSQNDILYIANKAPTPSANDHIGSQRDITFIAEICTQETCEVEQEVSDMIVEAVNNHEKLILTIIDLLDSHNSNDELGEIIRRDAQALLTELEKSNA